jgi:hypothetical protein
MREAQEASGIRGSFLLDTFLWTSKEKYPACQCGNLNSNKPSRQRHHIVFILRQAQDERSFLLISSFANLVRQIKCRAWLAVQTHSPNKISNVCARRNPPYAMDTKMVDYYAGRYCLYEKIRHLARLGNRSCVALPPASMQSTWAISRSLS